MKFNVGDIVVRKSYNRDIIFRIYKIYKTSRIVILKGIDKRIEADSIIDDLELIKKYHKNKILKNNNLKYNKDIEFKRYSEIYGKILHLDGDENYSEKSKIYYKQNGLNAIVINVPEYRQSNEIDGFLNKYLPDIVVITGHDGMIRRGYNYNDINNYRNSKYFIDTVNKIRKWENNTNKITIIAGACQSYYEGLISAGANFASSPERILIDFKDPLIVAQKIAISDRKDFINIESIKKNLRDEDRGISGIGSYGKKKILY